MALTIKICGLKTPDTLDVALESGADMVGFVFFAPSPRNLGLEAARTLGTRVRGRAAKVALTVNADNQMLNDIIEALKPDLLQLHGKETPEWVAVVRSRFGLPVMKALPIASRRDLSPIHLYAKVADRLIFDACPPREATRPGARTPFDWTLLCNINPGVPFTVVGWASMPVTSPRPSPLPARPASMCRPAWSARPASRIRPRSVNSSAPRAPPRRRSISRKRTSYECAAT